MPVNGGRRRSPRIALLIPINVAGQDVQKRAFSEAATATALKLQRAAVHLNRQLDIGSIITVRNRSTRLGRRGVMLAVRAAF